MKEKISETAQSADNSGYVVAALKEHCLNGDAYLTKEALYALCRREKKSLTYNTFHRDFLEQLRAGELALSSRLGLILGGAGSGKSTLIRAILDSAGPGCRCVVCAPTGKAARNDRERDCSNGDSGTLHILAARAEEHEEVRAGKRRKVKRFHLFVLRGAAGRTLPKVDGCDRPCCR